MTWLLILMIGPTGAVKYIEFPTKLACEAAVVIINDKSGPGWRPLCIEGGKPIPETRGVSVIQENK
jgi:hypothetical protein